MRLQAGYCTNVHAGADLAQTKANLERHAVAVKRHFSPDAPIGVGLWLSASSAFEMLFLDVTPEWRGWLAANGLVPFTMNAFPYGNFHADSVLHAVYQPTWMEQARGEYTLAVARVLDELLPAGTKGTISTLPIAWGTPELTRDQLRTAAGNLRAAAKFLAELESRSGRHIRLCLEPEPGCVLQRCGDVVRFFTEYLGEHDRDIVDRYLGVCHDVCHSAVMFEPQAEAIGAYRDAGITIGKVQVSAAVSAPPDAIGELRNFVEERYLHQTVKRYADGTTRFFENLPEALADPTPAEEWRTHFHVPIYLDAFGGLRSTQREIIECLTALEDDEPHFEVETYAWGVLPEALRQPELAAGIAEELRWFAEVRSGRGIGERPV